MFYLCMHFVNKIKCKKEMRISLYASLSMVSKFVRKKIRVNHHGAIVSKTYYVIIMLLIML